ncbi:transposase [Sulfuriflexus sp.]|uniref:transposase n=1 Tax=Sulfuriflexus sp. TaxID=2015443 RepID=UPI0028CC1EA4|nr:transposase [Sulfuriflexus sp.]MDT8405275.1 transposase [Sulfuriflexus sp.]
MPRTARTYLPGLPYHLVQRGNNREACFIEPENYQYYLELWKEVSRRYGVAVHAYCLMTNHIHFLVTPDTPTAISNATKVVGSRYAQYINRRYKRTGTLWEGRHRPSLIQSEKYLLICHRYVELNPVRAGMVARPEEYHWSSYGVNAWGDVSWLTPHEEYLRLGQTRDTRCHAYRELFNYQFSETDLHRIRKAAHYCQPVGDDRFRQQIEKKYGIKLGQMKRGRPRKKKDEEGG